MQTVVNACSIRALTTVTPVRDGQAEAARGRLTLRPGIGTGSEVLKKRTNRKLTKQMNEIVAKEG